MGRTVAIKQNTFSTILGFPGLHQRPLQLLQVFDLFLFTAVFLAFASK